MVDEGGNLVAVERLDNRFAHNLAWGGDDGKTLYLTAQGCLYRMLLNIPGIRPNFGIGDLSQVK